MEKAGVKTSEFWVTMLTILAAVVLAGISVWKGNTDSNELVVALLAIAGPSIGYSHARAKTKAGAPVPPPPAESSPPA